MSLHPSSVSTDYATMRATLRELNDSYDGLSCPASDCQGTLSARRGRLVCERCDSRAG